MSELLERSRAALVSAGITGPHHSHTRENAIGKIRAVIAGDTEDTFGVSGLDKYAAQEILGFVSELTGCPNDIADIRGYDEIDPTKTIDGIVAAARRLKRSADNGDLLFIATGHPTGLLEHHIRVADAYRRAGGKVLRLREDERVAWKRGRHREIRYTGGVGCLADWGALLHTHSAEPMEGLLDAGPWPDLVVGDHGFAGAALERGIPTIAVMDINDPALAVAWAEGKEVLIVPMDDNRLPRLYEPSWQIFEAILGGKL
jgi:hypothetical protein